MLVALQIELSSPRVSGHNGTSQTGQFGNHFVGIELLTALALCEQFAQRINKVFLPSVSILAAVIASEYFLSQILSNVQSISIVVGILQSLDSLDDSSLVALVVENGLGSCDSFLKSGLVLLVERGEQILSLINEFLQDRFVAKEGQFEVVENSPVNTGLLLALYTDFQGTISHVDRDSAVPVTTIEHVETSTKLRVCCPLVANSIVAAVLSSMCANGHQVSLNVISIVVCKVVSCLVRIVGNTVETLYGEEVTSLRSVGNHLVDVERIVPELLSLSNSTIWSATSVTTLTANGPFLKTILRPELETGILNQMSGLNTFCGHGGLHSIIQVSLIQKHPHGVVALVSIESHEMIGLTSEITSTVLDVVSNSETLCGSLLKGEIAVVATAGILVHPGISTILAQIVVPTATAVSTKAVSTVVERDKDLLCRHILQGSVGVPAAGCTEILTRTNVVEIEGSCFSLTTYGSSILRGGLLRIGGRADESQHGNQKCF